MKISKNTRPHRAGHQVAEGLCETAHILYLHDNRLQYLQGLIDRLEEEIGEANKK